MRLGIQGTVEPGARLDPVATNGPLGDIEQLRDLVFLHTREEAQLDDPPLARFEPLDRLVEREELLGDLYPERREKGPAVVHAQNGRPGIHAGHQGTTRVTKSPNTTC
jgi:hypothetical protein